MQRYLAKPLIKKTAVIDLEIGREYSNVDIMLLFKCSGQGGMRRSKETRTLVLVKDKASIYEDTWQNGICYYTGMGQEGDQHFYERQNKTLFNLPFIDVEAYLFESYKIGNKNTYKFCGKVVLAEKPYYDRQADICHHDRQVCIFPLRIKQSDADVGYVPEYGLL